MSNKTGDEAVDRSTAKVRDQGRPHGLFRGCMDQIRTSHTIGQSLRSAALAAGLLTDAKCYAELLGQFYMVTAALESRMEELLHNSGSSDCNLDSQALVAKVKSLGYSFKVDYERDLHSLLGPKWNSTIQSWTTEPAKRYIRRLESATHVECAAAAFILHGPLVIGGGAMLKPRVEKAFGEDATHVFESVIGAKRGGRSGRRREFIELYDTLLDDAEEAAAESRVENSESRQNGDEVDPSRDVRFKAIVEACGEFMQLNNEIMLAVRQAPWWRKYVAASAMAAVSALIWRLLAINGGPGAAVTIGSSNITA
mmetsp:Transcript_21532/g.46787  ORF Transcript_21532/g.46787 Transcript_21532/m.46787 type:complete len:311 (-) Transcript_21532:54-986(-)